MLQLASATGTLVQGGMRHRPRLVMATQDSVTRKRIDVPLEPPVNLGYNPEHVAAVKRGMAGVATEGTSARVFAGAGYASGGKTGTAQAVTIGQKDRYDARKLEEHQRDHALYMAYAPAEEPKIAVAVIVENAGFGADHAAPIARRVFDYWLLQQAPQAEDLAAVQKGQAAAPIKPPMAAASFPWPAAFSILGTAKATR
jgi:penicillin-binding protein 2